MDPPSPLLFWSSWLGFLPLSASLSPKSTDHLPNPGRTIVTVQQRSVNHLGRGTTSGLSEAESVDSLFAEAILSNVNGDRSGRPSCDTTTTHKKRGLKKHLTERVWRYDCIGLKAFVPFHSDKGGLPAVIRLIAFAKLGTRPTSTQNACIPNPIQPQDDKYLISNPEQPQSTPRPIYD